MEIERKELAGWKWWLIFVIDVGTSTLLLMMSSYGEALNIISYTFIITAAMRAAYFICLSVQLAGRNWIKFYLITDPLQMSFVAATIAFSFFLFTIKSPEIFFRYSDIANFIVYNFSMNGLCRVMLKCMKWNLLRILSYKIAKAYGIILYILFYLTNILELQINSSRLHPGVFLLFIMVMIQYLTIIFGLVSTFDGTASFKWTYSIQQFKSLFISYMNRILDYLLLLSF